MCTKPAIERAVVERVARCQAEGAAAREAAEAEARKGCGLFGCRRSTPVPEAATQSASVAILIAGWIIVDIGSRKTGAPVPAPSADISEVFQLYERSPGHEASGTPHDCADA